MPKSKRDKKISLTKTDKKGLVFKQKIIEDIRNCVEKFNSIYVFSYENMRTNMMQEVRLEWKPSRFFFGKNKVIGVGLGRTQEEEVEDGLHKLTKYLKGQCGLLFTDCNRKDVLAWFKSYSIEGYARSGFKTNVTVKLDKGPLNQFSHSREPYLRQLGMPTKLEKGVVTLIKDYEVCKKGSLLTPEQAKILEYLDIKLATFQFKLRACWIKGKGIEKLAKKESKKEKEQEEENDEDVDMEEEEG